MTYRSPLLNVMTAAALKAAKGLIRDFGELEQLQVSKKGPADFVSKADHRAEAVLRAELSKARPAYGMLLEETGPIEGTDTSNRWVVDPLDGTTNFLHGIPHFSISIGLERDGEPFAGVVYSPIPDEMFVAERGVGAYLNGRRLRVSGRRKVEESLFATGVPFLGLPDHALALRQVGAVMAVSTGIRRYGSAALDLAWVAAGRYDGYWENGLNPWDICAGIVLVREAGGFATDLKGGKRMFSGGGILASNATLHPELKALVASASAEPATVAMTRPGRYLVRMLLFLAAVASVATLLAQGLQHAFFTNIALNSLILGVFVLGILYNFRQVLSLTPEVNWLEHFRGDRPPDQGVPLAPRLLAPMATMLGERRGRLSLSAPAMRSLLDGIASRLDESRDLSRYMIGLLIFLGLLGTFWGLSQTIGSIGDVIGGLNVGGGDPAVMFDTLKRGLGTPLAGMGTAFSSSLFGLGGSLVLGFLDLQAGQAQNRFFNELEEWLSGSTRLASGTLAGDGEQAVPVYLQALLEQTAESLESLQRTMARGEELRSAGNTQLANLTETLGALADQMRAQQDLVLNLARSQDEIRTVLSKLAEPARPAAAQGLDEATRAHIRNLDVYVARLIEEMIAGREEIVRQIRSDIKLLARTIAAVADEGERQG